MVRTAWAPGMAAGASRGCRLHRRQRPRTGYGAALTWPRTASCAGAAQTSRPALPIGSEPPCTHAALASCCIGSASPASPRARAVPRPMRQCRRLSGCIQRPRDRGAAGCGARGGQPGRDPAPGRGPRRPAGHADPHLGGEGQQTVGAARPALQMGLHLRGSVRRAARRGRLGAALRQRLGHDPALGRDNQAGRTRRPRRCRSGPRRLAQAGRPVAPCRTTSACSTCRPTAPS